VSNEPEPNQSTDELDWSAFRYVAGEATPDEARALEERMAGDQAAREAVARAATLGLRLASSEQAVDEPRREATSATPPIAQATSALAWLQVREIGETTASVAGELEGPVAEASPSVEAADPAVVPSWMFEIAGETPGKGKP
jgi:hypothetical protein